MKTARVMLPPSNQTSPPRAPAIAMTITGRLARQTPTGEGDAVRFGSAGVELGHRACLRSLRPAT